MSYLQKTAIWPLCSTFSNGSHVFSWINNSNNQFVWDTLRNINANFHWILCNGFWEDFQSCTCEKCKKTVSGAVTPTLVDQLFWKFWHRSISWCWTILPSQKVAKGNSFWVICKKLQSDPYVLILVTVAMFFHGSKIPKVILCKTPLGTIKPSLKPVSLVVSEEKIL